MNTKEWKKMITQAEQLTNEKSATYHRNRVVWTIGRALDQLHYEIRSAKNKKPLGQMVSDAKQFVDNISRSVDNGRSTDLDLAHADESHVHIKSFADLFQRDWADLLKLYNTVSDEMYILPEKRAPYVPSARVTDDYAA